MKYKNTLQKGEIRYVVFREAGTWYAVGLEFNIVESGSTPQEALLLLFEALQGYIESARRIKARPQILNQKSDPEYEALWRAKRSQKRTASKEIFSIGEYNIPSRRALAPA